MLGLFNQINLSIVNCYSLIIIHQTFTHILSHIVCYKLQWGDYEDQMQRNVLKLGMCIPDACSALDLQTSLQSEFDEVFHHEHFKTIVKVDPIMCRVREDMFPYDTSYYVTM